MTVIGRTTFEPVATTQTSSTSAARPWGVGLDTLLEKFWDGLMRSLCRASRGYLCPPDMTSVMYPDDPVRIGSGNESQTVTRATGCCDAKLSGK